MNSIEAEPKESACHHHTGMSQNLNWTMGLKYPPEAEWLIKQSAVGNWLKGGETAEENTLSG